MLRPGPVDRLEFPTFATQAPNRRLDIAMCNETVDYDYNAAHDLFVRLVCVRQARTHAAEQWRIDWCQMARGNIGKKHVPVS
jgi:hypothetical protein